MSDFGRIVGLEWDHANARKSTDKHGVSQTEAEQIFFDDRLLVVEDIRHSRTEASFHALGRTDAGRHVHVTFTQRHQGTKIRVISARPMSRKERAVYDQEI